MPTLRYGSVARQDLEERQSAVAPSCTAARAVPRPAAGPFSSWCAGRNRSPGDDRAASRRIPHAAARLAGGDTSRCARLLFGSDVRGFPLHHIFSSDRGRDGGADASCRSTSARRRVGSALFSASWSRETVCSQQATTAAEAPTVLPSEPRPASQRHGELAGARAPSAATRGPARCAGRVCGLDGRAGVARRRKYSESASGAAATPACHLPRRSGRPSLLQVAGGRIESDGQPRHQADSIPPTGRGDASVASTLARPRTGIRSIGRRHGRLANRRNPRDEARAKHLFAHQPRARHVRGRLGEAPEGNSDLSCEEGGAEAEEEAEEDEEAEDEEEEDEDEDEDEDIPGFTVFRVRGSIQIPAAPSESRVSADASPAALTLDRSPIGEGGLGLCGGQSVKVSRCPGVKGAKGPKGKWAHGYKVKVEKWNSGTVERCKSVMCAEVQSVFIRRYGSRQPTSHLT
ncbi:hypothetical protein JHW43_007924 [Diplocarpon mali]|nr:hypothetical protein JHW43_007924 [Diplocarpon mali]